MTDAEVATETSQLGSLRVAVEASPNFDPRPTGISEFSIALTSRLPRHGVTVLPFVRGRHAGDALGLDGTTFPAGLRDRAVAWIPGTKASAAWRAGAGRLWVHRDAQVVHGTNFRAPILHGLSTLITLHDPYTFMAPASHADHLLNTDIRWAVSKGAHVHTVSRTSAEDFRRFVDIDDDRLHTIHPGAPALVDARLPAEDRDQLVLFLGSLGPRKNLVPLIEAFALVRRRNPEARMVLAGHPADAGVAALVSETIGRLGLDDHVELPGYVSAARRTELLSTARVLVYPSHYEGFGMPALEAMAHGTPVVASRAGALEEICGDAGVLVEPSAEAIAAAVLPVLSSSDRARELAFLGRERAAQFSWERMVGELCELYRTLS